MISKLKIIFQENKNLFSDMFLVTLASVISAFLSYYLNFYVQSIYVNVLDFSNYLLFITFIGFMTLIPNTISTSIVVTVNELRAQNRNSEIFDLFWKLMGIFLLISMIFFLLIYKFSSELGSIFNISISNFFLFSGIYIVFLILTVPISAFIYGSMQFKSYSSLIIGMVLVKIIGTGYFFKLGYGFNAIFLGFISSAIFFIVLGLIILILKMEKPNLNSSSRNIIGKIFLFSIPLLFISLGRDMISYLDFLIVKSRFDEVISGNYSLLLNIGKIFLFGSLIILGVMLPQIADSYNRKQDYFKKFKIYLYIELIIVFLGLLFFGLFPKFVIDTLIFVSQYLGLNSNSFSTYYQILDYLPSYSIFIALVVLINFFTLFLIAIQKYYIFTVYILCLLGQGLSIYYHASGISNVIIYNIICASCLLVYLIAITYRQYENFNHNSSL